MFINSSIIKKVFMAGFVVLFACGTVLAGQWPTYMHDNSRSGVTSDALDFASLEQCWTYKSQVPPQVAWDGGLPWDAYRSANADNYHQITPMRDFDFVLFVTAKDGNVYFGSSVTDAIHCLDAQTGVEKWFYVTDGPVRFPPSIVNDKLYFGSDDGFVYCVNAANGKFNWKYSPSGRTRLIGNNGSIIPLWPVRTGTAVYDGKVYFAASLSSWQSTYLCAVDAQTGSDSAQGCYKVSGGVTPMGPILVSPSKIYLLQGRLCPYVFSRSNGATLGTAGAFGNGGCYALLSADGNLVQGYGQAHTSAVLLREFNASNDIIATHSNARRLVIDNGVSYIHTDSMLTAVSRSTGATIWTKSSDHPFCLIKTGNYLIAGGLNKLTAFDCSNGNQVWQAQTKGRVRGLAVCDGRLYASTDTGRIYMYAQKQNVADLNKDGSVDNVDLLKFSDQYLQKSGM